jgi:hypothetical protein
MSGDLMQGTEAVGSSPAAPGAGIVGQALRGARHLAPGIAD